MTLKNFNIAVMMACVISLLGPSIVVADDGHVFDPDDPCTIHGVGIYPHPHECQLFYNCSRTSLFQLHWAHLDECKYPDLFSLETNSCERYSEVDCHERTEFVNACDYKQNQCFGGHCRPCNTLWPKCEERNGITHYQYMIGSPFYGICQDWRVVARRQCKTGIFDAVTKSCIIPTADMSV